MRTKHLRYIVTIVFIFAVLFATAPGALAASPTLRVGSSGSEVTKLQDKLIQLGYTDFSSATGYYGGLTRTAVIRFQSAHRLTADGLAGKATQGKLYASGAKSLNLREGSSGEAVRTLQLRLKELGYFSGTGTGYYGTVTKTAVIAFQKAHGLSADGIAGPKTRNRAFSNNAVPAGTNAGANANAAPAPPANSGAPSRASIADIALGQLGVKYVLGGNGPTTFDCSGLAYYAMNKAGYKVSDMSSAGYSTQSAWTKITGTAGLQKGDLLFFYSENWSYIGHMGIYTGDGQFVHASSGQGKVIVSKLSNSYWSSHYAFARRVG